MTSAVLPTRSSSISIVARTEVPGSSTNTQVIIFSPLLGARIPRSLVSFLLRPSHFFTLASEFRAQSGTMPSAFFLMTPPRHPQKSQRACFQGETGPRADAGNLPVRRFGDGAMPFARTRHDHFTLGRSRLYQFNGQRIPGWPRHPAALDFPSTAQIGQ